MKESYGTLSQTINGLKKDGYPIDFSVLKDNLVCQGNVDTFAPEDFKIDKTFRFEGATNPGDESILYAISSVKHDLKGILINGYGISADSNTNDVVLKLTNRDL
ncbi:phosphoribosylpyrophosphate synthetase [Pedobacter endophyticus]|uniref:Phosphoribosylpyrophosphate synthetase n=1 Tax=Pedobacter endophyticus TaxID=2789740 RepID=A0A7U3SPG7_9SPHI|nr:phosphoribosylpyrophosphate synthetase [Pedobacter endophyticus]QPH38598.1 phosphoribosylpyrophosphate synthetase [Pedobacter endophyticus]